MKFHPLHFGWAALPAHPHAIVIFLGGAFFGSFPTVFYRAYLRDIYEAGYGIVALPFRFSLRHWDISLSLASYQSELRAEVAALLMADGLQNEPVCSVDYLWIAHSLGCKYVALLELLSDSEEISKSDNIISALKLEVPEQADELLNKLSQLDAHIISLRDQQQILVDPVIADLEAAIPLPFLRSIFDSVLKVHPSQAMTIELIKSSALFSITSVLSLASRTAELTLNQLAKISKIQSDRMRPPIQLIPIKLSRSAPLFGRHLSILGYKRTDQGIRDETLSILEKSRVASASRACSESRDCGALTGG
ncbi:DUF1350 family protein [Synechococcus sp. MW101C3]|uniref:DUF1350 family protein n=1 Tax=Synechococcus sp. MW101C3 TaxID=210768 RepID=UPI000B99D163|nr:DUF1350 family protein [Synechococcus sp. MW101C3]